MSNTRAVNVVFEAETWLLVRGAPARQTEDAVAITRLNSFLFFKKNLIIHFGNLEGVVGKSLYAVGGAGEDGVALDTAARFDEEEQRWEEMEETKLATKRQKNPQKKYKKTTLIYVYF